MDSEKLANDVAEKIEPPTFFVGNGDSIAIITKSITSS